MKEMTYEEKIEKCAKTLIKRFKEHLKDEDYEDNTTIFISNQFTSVTTNGNRDVIFDYRDKWSSVKGANVSFGDIGERDFASVTCAIATKIKSLLKMPSKYRVFFNEEKRTEWCGWSSLEYWITYGIVYVKPCKEFNAINKKLARLGCAEIPFEKWWYGDVHGKRSNYNVCGRKYFATDKTMCDKVLDYLKGKKKKISYEFVSDDDMSNMEYGIHYETEWSGSVSYKLKFTDVKGNAKVIY